MVECIQPNFKAIEFPFQNCIAASIADLMANPRLKDLLMNQLKAGIITPDTNLNLKMHTGGDGQGTPKASKDLDLPDKIFKMNYQVRSLTYSCNEENIPIYEHRFNGSTDDLKCSCMSHDQG